MGEVNWRGDKIGGDGAKLKGCTQRPSVILGGGTGNGVFCACSEMWQAFLRPTPENVVSRGGSIGLFLLASTFAGRAWAKQLHKKEGISCFTYRKIKDMVSQQPWFCIPLIAIPVIKYNSNIAWRPPFLSYALLTCGWMLNTTGHVLMITTKDERFRKYCVPISYFSLAMSGAMTIFAMLVKGKGCCC